VRSAHPSMKVSKPSETRAKSSKRQHPPFSANLQRLCPSD
jgi:hypothetical protein